MNKLILGSLLILFATIFTSNNAIAQISEGENDTRIEKYEDLTETESTPATTESDMDAEAMEVDMDKQDAEEPQTRTEEKLEETQSSNSSNYDVRQTEAFNLVSSAYRGDFEDQGINSYAVLVSNYEAGELTAEDLINAAIESGELSPSALEDESYVEAVDSQLNALSNN